MRFLLLADEWECVTAINDGHKPDSFSDSCCFLRPKFIIRIVMRLQLRLRLWLLPEVIEIIESLAAQGCDLLLILLDLRVDFIDFPHRAAAALPLQR